MFGLKDCLCYKRDFIIPRTSLYRILVTLKFYSMFSAKAAVPHISCCPCD